MDEFTRVFADKAVRLTVRKVMDDRPSFRVESGIPDLIQSKLDELDRVVAEKAIQAIKKRP